MTKKLLILADDHPQVRHALENVLSSLHESVTIYTADDAQELRPLADRHLEGVGDLTLINICVNDVTSGGEQVCPAELHAPTLPADRETRPLIVISARERGVTAHWFASVDPGGTPDDDGTRLQAALDQREVVMDLIRSLHVATGQGGEVEAASELPDLESLVKLGLTHRQAEVLLSLAEGLTNKEIARQLGVSEWTVRNHVSAILTRLDVSNRGRAAMFARRLAGG